MNQEPARLNQLLRCMLTAVEQQFCHLTMLRLAGDHVRARRIAEVDSRDFRTAMSIMELLIRTRSPLDLARNEIAIGSTLKDILAAELVHELRLQSVIEGSAFDNPHANDLLALAAMPRSAYRTWLHSQLDDSLHGHDARRNRAAEPEPLMGCLLTAIEQFMAHAFVHRGLGDDANADIAWCNCSSVMTQVMKLLELVAGKGLACTPGHIPVPQVHHDPETATEADRRLAARCSAEAFACARTCRDAEIADHCRTAGEFHARLAESSFTDDCSRPSHNSFSGTLKRLSIGSARSGGRSPAAR